MSVLVLVLAPMPLVFLDISNAEWLLLFFLLLGWRAGRPRGYDGGRTALRARTGRGMVE